LPKLGRIDATLLVAAGGVSITLHAADEKALALFAAQRTQLQQSLRKAGVTPLGVTVRRDDST
jgi:hypothetical protein